MARKRKHERVNHERWLVSYADFITLLFAFFVVLYASSQADKGKMAKLATSIQQAFSDLGTFPRQTIGPPLSTVTPTGVLNWETSAIMPLVVHSLSFKAVPRRADQGATESLRRALQLALADELRRNEVALSVGPDGLVISLREVGFFESGSAEIRNDAVAAFSRLATILKTQNCALRLEGHTDDVPIHTSHFESNWELSAERATRTVRRLITDHDFSPSRLSAAGFAEYHPIASNVTPSGRRANRRVDIIVLEPHAADSWSDAAAAP